MCGYKENRGSLPSYAWSPWKEGRSEEERRELQEIHVLQNRKHLSRAGVLVVVPHGIPVIDVKAHQLSKLMRPCHRILSSLYCLSRRQGTGTRLHDPAGFQILVPDLALIQQHIGARLSRKGKAPVVVLIE